MSEPVFLVASGDLRLAANQKCWPAQELVEAAVAGAVRRAGREVKRGHPFDPVKRHGFIDSQKYGMQMFCNIPRTAPLIVVEAAWQYSHHVLHGLITHQGPILDGCELERRVARSGRDAESQRVAHQSRRSILDAVEPRFHRSVLSARIDPLASWRTGWSRHFGHVHALAEFRLAAAEETLAREIAETLQRDKAILGVFDEGCMGMYNAIIPDELLHPTGVFQRTTQPIGFICRDAADARMRRRERRVEWLDQNGHEVRDGSESGDGSYR